MGVYSNQMLAGMIQNLFSSGVLKKKKRRNQEEKPSEACTEREDREKDLKLQSGDTERQQNA